MGGGRPSNEGNDLSNEKRKITNRRNYSRTDKKVGGFVKQNICKSTVIFSDIFLWTRAPKFHDLRGEGKSAVYKFT